MANLSADARSPSGDSARTRGQRSKPGGRAVLDDRLSDVLSEFARTLGTDFPIQGILDHLVHRIVDVLPIDAAGVTLISPHTHPRYIAASNEPAMRFEHLQTELNEGPCLAAYETNSPISIPDVSDDDRFPVFASRAAAEGLAAVFTFPLRDGDQGLGALDLYREAVGALGETEMAAAQTLADVATAYLLNARTREELKASSATEHDALNKLRLVDQTKDEHLATVIHELRTPMTSIAGYTEMLQESDLDATQRRLLDAVARNSDRLTAQADDLLTLLSLEQTTVTHEYLAVDLNEVLAAAHATLQPLIDGQRLEVSFAAPATAMMISGNFRDLERMVTNLISNAMKYTDDPGWVRVTLTPVEDHAHLEVSDNGIGISPDEQAQLFTRFFRSGVAQNRAISGSGLGLTIVESIVKRHAGTISVVSTPGHGSTFVVDLPLEDKQQS